MPRGQGRACNRCHDKKVRCDLKPVGPRVNKRKADRESGSRSRSPARPAKKARKEGRREKRERSPSEVPAYRGGRGSEAGRRTRYTDRLEEQVRSLSGRVSALETHHRKLEAWIHRRLPEPKSGSVRRRREWVDLLTDEEDAIETTKKRLVRSQPRIDDRAAFEAAHEAELEYGDPEPTEAGAEEKKAEGEGELDAQGEREEPTGEGSGTGTGPNPENGKPAEEGEGSGAGAGPNPEDDEVVGPGAEEEEGKDEEERGPSVPPIVTEPEPEDD